MELIMKTIKNKLFTLIALMALGINMQPMLGMTTEQYELNKKLLDAGAKGNLQDVKSLIKRGADINAQDKFSGWTPLHFAAFYNELDALKLLVQLGADVNTQDKSGWTPLHYAARDDKLDALKFLVQLGADINAKNKDGRTPLHDAALNNELDALKLLVQLGADVNAKNKDGRTPLHFAAFYNELDALKFLVQHGADVSLEHDAGKTAYDLALERGHAAIITYLDNVKNYNDYGTMVRATPENEMTVPDYFALAILKQNVLDLQNIFKDAFQSKIDAVPYLPYYLKIAPYQKKSLSLHELAWLKIYLPKNITTCSHERDALMQKNSYYIKNRTVFTDTNFGFN